MNIGTEHANAADLTTVVLGDVKSPPPEVLSQMGAVPPVVAYVLCKDSGEYGASGPESIVAVYEKEPEAKREADRLNSGAKYADFYVESVRFVR